MTDINNNWYIRYAISKELLKEAGWKENIATGLMAAILMVLSGSTVEAASKQTKVPAQTISNALKNKELVEKTKQVKKTEDSKQNIGKDKKMQKEVKTDEAVDIYELIKRHEGCTNKVYIDTRGKPTIGIGFNLSKNGARKMIESVGADYDKILAGKQTLSEDQIKILFNNDMKSAVKSARSVVSNFDSLPQKAQAILIDMAFNLGTEGLSKFKNMRAALEVNNYNRAAYEMKDSDWYTQVGNRSKELIKMMQSLAYNEEKKDAAKT